MLPGHKAPPTRTTLCAPMFERGTCWTDAPEPSDGGSAEATTRSNRCAIKLRQSAPSGPKRQPVGARPVLDGVRGPRVPSSGDRELRAPPYHQPRVWQCDPALLRCASPSAERVSRPRTRLSVTIRKLGVVLSSIPPDCARRTPPVARHHPPDAGPHPCGTERLTECALSSADKGLETGLERGL